MILYFRFLLLYIKLRFFRKKVDPFHPITVRFRVLPTDIDFFNFHMTNSRYPALIDLVRSQFIAESGIWDTLKVHGWHGIMGAAYIRFRRDLRTFDLFTVKFEVAFVSDKWVYFDVKFMKDGFVHCHMLEKWGLAQKGLGMVPPNKYLPELPEHLSHMKPPSHIAKLMDAEEEFRAAVRKDF